jgi:hypothetical protein
MVSRRSTLAMMAAAFSFPRMALGQPMQFAPNDMLANLSKSIWLSTNRSASRAAYVYAAPWCPFCEQLYQAQRDIRDIDFRYIFKDFRGPFGAAIANAFFSNENDQVGLFYSDTRAQNPALSFTVGGWIEQINDVTLDIMSNNNAYMGTVQGSGGSGSGSGLAYPTIFQRESDNAVRGYLGGWTNLPAITSANATSASEGPDVFRYAQLLRTAPQPQRATTAFFAREARAPYFAAPVPEAPLVNYQWQRHTGGRMDVELTIEGTRWFGYRAFTNGDGYFWGRAEDFIEQ